MSEKIFSLHWLFVWREKRILLSCVLRSKRERETACVGEILKFRVGVSVGMREIVCEYVCVCQREREWERESDGAVFVGWRCGEVTFNCLQSHITKPIFHPKAKNTSHSLSHSLPISLSLSLSRGKCERFKCSFGFFSFTQKFGGDPIFVVYFHRV